MLFLMLFLLPFLMFFRLSVVRLPFLFLLLMGTVAWPIREVSLGCMSCYKFGCMSCYKFGCMSCYKFGPRQRAALSPGSSAHLGAFCIQPQPCAVVEPGGGRTFIEQCLVARKFEVIMSSFPALSEVCDAPKPRCELHLAGGAPCILANVGSSHRV